MIFSPKFKKGLCRRGYTKQVLNNTCLHPKVYRQRSHLRNAPHWKPGQHSESLLQLLSPRDQVQIRVFLNCSSPQHALKADATYIIAGILRTNTPRRNRFVFFILPPIFIRE